MDSTAQRSADAVIASEAVGATPGPAASPVDSTWTAAEPLRPLEAATPLTAAPPWLAAVVVLFWIALLVGSAMRRGLLRHPAAAVPGGGELTLPRRIRVHTRSGIRAHIRPVSGHAARRDRS